MKPNQFSYQYILCCANFVISSARMIVLTLILTVFLLIFQSENVLTTEIILDRIELVNTTYLEGFYNMSELRISRINRTTYVLNAQIITYFVLDQNWEIEVSFFRNRFNNNQYYKMPFRFPRTSACQVLDQYYVKYLQPGLKGITNLPQFKEGEHFCPIKKVSI